MRARQVWGMIGLLGETVLLATGCGAKPQIGSCVTPVNSHVNAYNSIATTFVGDPTPIGTVPKELECKVKDTGYAGKKDTFALEECGYIVDGEYVPANVFWAYQEDFKPCEELENP